MLKLNKLKENMKVFLLLLVLLATNINLFAQDSCSGYVKTVNDRIFGKTTVVLQPVIISDAQSGFQLNPFLFKDSIVVNIKFAGGEKCIDDQVPLTFSLEDSTVAKVANQTKYNCDQEASLFFGRVFHNLKELDMLATKKVNSLSLPAMKTLIAATLKPDQSQLLFNQMRCLKIEGQGQFDVIEEKPSEQSHDIVIPNQAFK